MSQLTLGLRVLPHSELFGVGGGDISAQDVSHRELAGEHHQRRDHEEEPARKIVESAMDLVSTA